MEIFASCFFLTSRWRWRCCPAVPSPERWPTSSRGPAGSGALASVGLQRSPGVLPQWPEHGHGAEGWPGAQEEGAGHLSLGICRSVLDFSLQRVKQESCHCHRKKANCYLNRRTRYNELTAMLCNFMIRPSSVRTQLGSFWFALAWTLRSGPCFSRIITQFLLHWLGLEYFCHLPKDLFVLFWQMLTSNTPLPWVTWQELRNESQTSSESILSMMLEAKVGTTQAKYTKSM